MFHRFLAMMEVMSLPPRGRNGLQNEALPYPPDDPGDHPRQEQVVAQVRHWGKRFRKRQSNDHGRSAEQAVQDKLPVQLFQAE